MIYGGHIGYNMGCTSSLPANADSVHRKNKDSLEVEWYKEFLPEHDQKVEILHFNDVYNIDGKIDDHPVNDFQEIMAGADRFRTAFDMYKSSEKLVIFSGDLFFPSISK